MSTNPLDQGKNAMIEAYNLRCEDDIGYKIDSVETHIIENHHIAVVSVKLVNEAAAVVCQNYERAVPSCGPDEALLFLLAKILKDFIDECDEAVTEELEQEIPKNIYIN